MARFERSSKGVVRTDHSQVSAAGHMTHAEIERRLLAIKQEPPKVTFGLVQDLTVSDRLTLYYVVRVGGQFIDCVAKIADTPPAGSDAILDIKKSPDDGATWTSIFPAENPNKIVLPAGGTDKVVVKVFADSPNDHVAPGDLLKISCLQTGSSTAGAGIEVVLQWA